MSTDLVSRSSEISSRAKVLVSCFLFPVFIFGVVQGSSWIFGYKSIITMWPGAALSSFNTSLSMLVAAAGIATLLKESWILRSRWVAFILGVVALTAGLYTSTQFRFALDAIIQDAATEMQLSSSTSLYTAFAFFLLSVALAIRSSRFAGRWPLSAGILGVAVSAIGIAGFLAHLLGIIPETGPRGLSSLAFSTSLGLAFLGTALVIIETERSEHDKYYWLPPMAGTLSLVITFVLSQALHGQYLMGRVSSSLPLMTLTGGLLLSVLIAFFSYFALSARRSLKLVEEKKRELRELNAVLEAKVLERTRELEISNAELDRFSAMAAHDLKSPVNSMTQFAQLLSEECADKLTQEEQTWLGTIVRSGERARRMIDSLLEFARAGKSAHNYEILNANLVIKAAIENLNFDITKAHANIELAPLPDVCGDKVQLTQLFQNLLANAIKFRKKEESPKIRIRIHDKSDSWEICVQDNGVGFDQKNASNVFRFFTRLHSEEEYHGTGLGLAMCRRIVENHGGKIWLESAINRGTQVHFTLPKIGEEESRC